MIREYAEPDWQAIWAIFQEVISAGDSIAYDPTMTSDQARAMWTGSSTGRTVVACDPSGSRVIGTATMGPNRPGRGSHVATATFMVAADTHGRGVGRALGEHVLAWARSRGHAAIQFNAVVESNAAAVHLWQSLGLRIVGTVPEAFEHPTLGRVGLHVMHRFL